MGVAGRIGLVNNIFFLSWLALTVVGYFWKSYSRQNRNYLVLGGLFAILIPLVNGFTTGDWIWNTWSSYHWVAYVDLFWLLAGVTSLYLSFFVLKVKKGSDYPELLGDEEAKTTIEQKVVPEPVINPNLTPQPQLGFEQSKQRYSNS